MEFNLLYLHPQLRIGTWCNGSTEVFGTFSQGSNPCEPTIKKPRKCGAFLVLNGVHLYMKSLKFQHQRSISHVVFYFY